MFQEVRAVDLVVQVSQYQPEERLEAGAADLIQANQLKQEQKDTNIARRTHQEEPLPAHVEELVVVRLSHLLEVGEVGRLYRVMGNKRNSGNKRVQKAVPGAPGGPRGGPGGGPLAGGPEEHRYQYSNVFIAM